MRRMDRYKDEDIDTVSRIDKNQELYQNFSSNAIYTNITDVTNANAYEINNTSNNYTSREQYQQLSKFQNMEPLPKNKKDLEDVNYLYKNRENKVYDINSVLENARKNRQDIDELDSKRKLKNNAYNILSEANRKELEKYREEKKNRLMTPQEEEIRELVDTIASKTLAGEIDKATSVDLLSDLMATNIFDKVEPQKEENNDDTLDEPTITQIIEEVNAEDTKDIKLNIAKEKLTETKKEATQELTTKEQFEKKDTDFYTKSMDLSDKDFLFDDFGEKKLPLIVRILLLIIVLAIMALAVYFIYQKIF